MKSLKMFTVANILFSGITFSFDNTAARNHLLVLCSFKYKKIENK